MFRGGKDYDVTIHETTKAIPHLHLSLSKTPSPAAIGTGLGLLLPCFSAKCHHTMVRLHEKGLLTQRPGVARSLMVAIPASEIPELEDE